MLIAFSSLLIDFPSMLIVFYSIFIASNQGASLEEANALLADLQKMNSEKMLADAMRASHTEDIDSLENAIELARMRGRCGRADVRACDARAVL